MSATARVRVEKRGYTCAEAMNYLGLKRRAFEKHIRPRLPPPTPCGTTHVFERGDLDRAWDEYRASRCDPQSASDRRLVIRSARPAP